MPNLNVETLPIWADVKKVLESGPKATNFKYAAAIHTPDADYNVLKVLSIHQSRDYGGNIGDVIHMTFKIPVGDYLYILYPYRSNFEVTVKETLLGETVDKDVSGHPIIVTRYKGVLIPGEAGNFKVSDAQRYSQEELNLRGVIDLQVELLDRSLEPLRIKTVRGVYRESSNDKIIHSLLLGESQKVLVDGKPSVDGIDYIDFDNKTQHHQVVIPDGTPISTIPSYLQEKVNGLYRSGAGTYLQYYKDKKLWFVYPLFDTTLYDRSMDRDKAIIIAVPSFNSKLYERTYLEDGGVLTILATSNKEYQDNADVDTINQGVGFRMADARAMMKKPVELTEQGPVGKRTQVNFELTNRERPDGLNYAPVVKGGPSSNPYKEYTKVLAREGARVHLEWYHSNPRLIYPGMPCKFVYMDGEDLKDVKGIILNCESVTEIQGKPFTTNMYKTKTMLSIFVEKITDIPEVFSYESAGEM